MSPSVVQQEPDLIIPLVNISFRSAFDENVRVQKMNQQSEMQTS